MNEPEVNEQGRVKDFDPDVRYKNLLIALSREIRSREIYAAQLLLQDGYASNKSRAHEINKSAARMRWLLGRNGKAVGFYFGTLDPEIIRANELERDDIDTKMLKGLGAAKAKVDSALWAPNTSSAELFKSALFALKRLVKNGFKVMYAGQEVDPKVMTLAAPEPSAVQDREESYEVPESVGEQKD